MTDTNNVNQVSVGKPKVGGAVFRGDTSLTLPTTAVATLVTGFAGMGYVSEDGVTRTITRETTEIKAWGGDTIATPQTSKSETVQLKFVQALNTEVLEAAHGDSNVTGDLTSGIAITENAKELEEKAWVIDQVLADGRANRLVIPKGKVTEIGDIVYKDDEPIGYELTITALPDSSGNTSYEYIGATSASGASGTS